MLKITINSRSSTEIVEFINKVVDQLTLSTYTTIKYKSNKPIDSTSFISEKHFSSSSDEAAYIAQSINKIKSENAELSFGDFAIILKQRTAGYLAKTEKVFKNHKIVVRNENADVCKGGLKYQDLVEYNPLSE